MRRIFFNLPAWSRFIFVPIMAAAFLALISYVVMQLWNNLLPDIIHVGTITLTQAAGIFILCKILFGFGRPGGRFGGDRSMFKKRLAERMQHMDPEERARFKEQFGNKFDRCRNNRWGSKEDETSDI
ncbi:hypothetical protein [Pedobacter sp. L105]|uniref:hypothetical protein n=1 Tax=Pedobacter sp. L105 TaxID=1641871 RepID=UPI001C2054AF|nr:hypothetical protein [Pedobacter sp. L105]